MKKAKISFVTGAIALVFAVVGYQTALLVNYSAVTKIAADRDTPDTVFIYSEVADSPPSSGSLYKGNKGKTTLRRTGHHTQEAERIRRNVSPKIIETFHFDPNTVSVQDMLRLGFSAKQAESIEHYRQKGGRFRSPEDFAKSYAVSDSVFRRLKDFIDIPKLDINKADSAEFDTLPGIGGYFARKMVEYRQTLGGYSFPEQLMDIYHFDQEKFDKLKDLICLSPPNPYPLWTLPEDSLSTHPYIKNIATARGIIFFRNHNPVSQWTVGNLRSAGVLTVEQASALERCVLEKPLGR